MRLLAILVLAELLPLGPSSWPNPGAHETVVAPGDQADLEQLARAFYEAYARKDLEGVSGLWSPRSPERETNHKVLQRLADSAIEGTAFEVLRIAVRGERATVRVALQTNAFAPEPGEGSVQHVKRTLQLVSEQGQWRIWREGDSLDVQAEALTAAAEEDRQSLLEDEPDLLGPPLVETLVRQADARRVKGELEEALRGFELARALAERDQNLAGQAAALRGIGIVHNMRGDLMIAQEHYRRGLDAAESAGSKPDIARLLGNLGIVLWQQGYYVEALEHHQRSLAIVEELGDKRLMAGVLGNIALVHDSLGNLGESLEYSQRALRLSEAAGNKIWMARAFNVIGNAHVSLGDYVRARESYERALALAEEMGDQEQEAGVISNLGLVHRLQGDYAVALEHYQRSLTDAEEMGGKGDVARLLSSIATIYSEQGDQARALEQYGRSLAIREAIGDRPGAAQNLNNMGRTFRRQGLLDQAREHQRRSLALAEAVGHGETTVDAMLDLAEVHMEMGDHEPASALANRSVDLARRIGYRDALWRSWTALARVHRAAGQGEQTKQALAEAIATIEELSSRAAGGEAEQQRAFEERLSPYRLLARMLLEEGRVAEGLQLVERTKARVLRDVIASGRMPLTRAMSAEERMEERRLNAEIVSLNVQDRRERLQPEPDLSRLAKLERQLEAVRGRHEAYLARLYARHPELRLQRGESPPLGVEEAEELLSDPQLALLEYAVVEGDTYLLVLTPGPPKPLLQPYRLNVTESDLRRLCTAFRGQLARRDLRYAKAARELYDLLLGPARAQLRGRTRLIIVPDGPLWELPFQALHEEDGRALIEERAISYAPSLTVLRQMSRSRASIPGGKSLLALGNPVPGAEGRRAGETLMGRGLEPLPDAEKQVQALARIYGPSAAIYVGEEAREDRVKAEARRFAILHFATHGILNDRSPLYSQLVLAPGEGGDDGLLEAREILDLELNAEQAVLSAWETARGRVGAGEGVIGLSWAFFVAGCPSIVVSQWKVESASASELMLEFHRKLKAGHSKDRALQLAARKLARTSRYRHPFYWAPFVVVGTSH